MYKACSKCGKIHPYNEKCPVGRVFSINAERKLRSSNAWKRKSEEIREKANHLCEVCRDQGEITYGQIEVHHITKLSEDSSGLLDNYNLVALCVEHHKQADNNEIDKEYLLKLARDREQGQGCN